MRLGYTILYVGDVRRSVAFYEAAFGLSPKFVHEGGDFAEMDTGNTSLAFCSLALLQQLGKTPQAPSPQSPCFEIAFVVDDVELALARALDKGATLQQVAQRMDWGQTVAYVSDPDGFTVELCTPMG